MKAKITKRLVDATSAKHARVFVWDSELKGFGLVAHPPSRVHPDGHKAYVLRYVLDGRDRRMTLGPHGQLTPAQARLLAAERLGQVRSGRDPLVERRAAREATRDPQTVAWLFSVYEKARTAPDAKPRPWKEATAREVRRIREREIEGSKLGARPLRDVTAKEIEGFHRSFMRRDRPSPYVANRVISWLSGAFRFALAEGYRTDGVNPCAAVKRFEEAERDRVFTLPELARLGEAMDELAESPSRGRPKRRARRLDWGAARDALRLLALTGLRRSNVLGLRWTEVDLGERILVLEDTKTGKKLKALGPEAHAVLARRQAKSKNSAYVFPSSRSDGPVRDLRGYIDAVYKQAKIEGATDHHVWRHTFASHAAELGFSELVIGHMLGHASRSITSKYVKIDEIVRTAEERVQARIAAALDRRAPARVLPLPAVQPKHK